MKICNGFIYKYMFLIQMLHIIFFIGHKLSVHKQQQTTTAHLITYLEIIQSINKMILLSLKGLLSYHIRTLIAGFGDSSFIIKFVLFAAVSLILV